MKQSNTFLFNKDISIETVGKGVTRQILGYNRDIMLVKVIFEEGSVGDMHSHPHIQSSYIESGKFKVTIDNEKQVLEKGDGFFVFSNSRHGLICLESGVVIDTFTPVREDFLIVK